MVERKAVPVEVGDCVILADALGVEHEALVTAVWGSWETGDPSHGTPVPSLNVVIVSGDPAEQDQYGRQIKRETSVVHQSSQAAHGMYWRNAGTG